MFLIGYVLLVIYCCLEYVQQRNRSRRAAAAIAAAEEERVALAGIALWTDPAWRLSISSADERAENLILEARGAKAKGRFLEAIDVAMKALCLLTETGERVVEPVEWDANDRCLMAGRGTLYKLLKERHALTQPQN